MIDKTLVYVLPLLAVLVSCSAQPPQAQNPAAPSPSPAASPANLKTFAEGTITGEDFGLALAGDGKTIYFARRNADRSSAHIYLSRQENGKWSAPQVAEFSGQFFDNEPFFSPDGTKLFFASMRPIEGTTAKKDVDLWVLEKTANGWSAPKHLGEPVNSGSYDNYPSVSKNGNLYFGSEREGGRGAVDLYRARFENGKYLTPENLGPTINSDKHDADPYIAPDESYLIFSSSRQGSLGEGDLFISFRNGNDWTAPRSLGPKVNSTKWDYGQVVSGDGKWLYFSRGWGNVYEVEMKELDVTPPASR